MSLEAQLRFDISRCSQCSLGNERKFCSPTFSTQTDVMLLFASPDGTACIENNPWSHASVRYLKKILQYAHGADLNRFHVSFITKCHIPQDQKTPSMNERIHWGRTCSQHYFDYEIKAVGPKIILAFGETVTRLCFPDEMVKFPLKDDGISLNFQPYDVPTHIFENPLSLATKGGISSEKGLQWVNRLHKLLGGTVSQPQVNDSQALFDLL